MKTPKRPRKPKMEATMPMPGGMAQMHDEMKFRAQDALHTLKRAHEIKADPHLMTHVKKHAAAERDALGKIIRRKT